MKVISIDILKGSVDHFHFSTLAKNERGIGGDIFVPCTNAF